MAPAVTRDITVTYGGITLGGSTDRQAFGPMSLSVGYDQLTLSFPFLVTAGMQADISTLEDGLRKPEQDLTIAFGASTQSYKASDSTGFNHRAELVKAGGPRDTRLQRLYTFVCTVDLPADLTGQAGRKDARYTILYDGATRRTVIFTGAYTPVSGETSALAQYSSAIVSYVTGVLASHGTIAIYDLASETVNVDDFDTRCDYERRYLEVIDNQASGVLNHASITNDSLAITRSEQGSDDTPAGGTIKRPQRVTASYSAEILKTESQVSFYASTIRPRLIEAIKAAVTVGTSEGALMDESPTFNDKTGQFSCSMVWDFYQPVGPAKATAHSLETSKENVPGKVLTPLWATGKPYSKLDNQGPARQMLRVTETLQRIGKEGDLWDMAFHLEGLDGITLDSYGVRPKGIPKAGSPANASSPRWVLIGGPNETRRARRVGLDADTVDLLEYTRVEFYERADTPPSGAVTRAPAR